MWIPDSLPFHVTDASKLQIICPLKYRVYADRVEEYVPIFKERVKLGKTTRSKGVPNFLNIPALPAIQDEGACAPSGAAGDAEFLLPSVDGENLDLLISIPDVVACDSPEDIENMKRGLQRWVDGGEAGWLAWGIFRFERV